MKYFQTWHYVARLNRWTATRWMRPVIQSICWAAGFGSHHISKTEWGYGGGDRVDVWCRWCNKQFQISTDEASFRFPQFRPTIKQHLTVEVEK